LLDFTGGSQNEIIIVIIQAPHVGERDIEGGEDPDGGSDDKGFLVVDFFAPHEFCDNMMKLNSPIIRNRQRPGKQAAVPMRSSMSLAANSAINLLSFPSKLNSSEY